MINFRCSICNQKLSVPNQYVGRTVKCPKCGNILKAIPDVEVVAAEDSEETESQAAELESGFDASASSASAAPQSSGPSPSQEESPGTPAPSRSVNAVIVAVLILTFGFTGFMAVRQFRTSGPDKGGKTVLGDKKSPQANDKPSGLTGSTTRPALAVPVVGPNGLPASAQPRINEPPRPIPPKPIKPTPIVPAPPAPPKPPTPPAIPKVEPTVQSPPEPVVDEPGIEATPAVTVQNDGRPTVPDRAAYVEALKNIKTVFRDDYRKTDSEGRRNLARQLLDRARETQDDPTARYVMLHESITQAAKAGDKDLAMESADSIADLYGVDRLDLKLDAVNAFAEGNRTPETARTAAETLLQFAQECVTSDNYRAAVKCAAAAFKYAPASRDPMFIAQVKAKSVEVKRLATEFDSLRESRKLLETDPENPKANLAVGKFLCFAKDDWDKGLPMLVKGPDEAVKAMAEKELARPADPQSQIDLADAWWNLAEKTRERNCQIRYKKRAAFWYEQPLTELTGLTKARAEKRIQEVEGLESSAAAGIRGQGGKRRTVDLTKLVDPQKDTVFGFWKRNRSGELVSDNRHSARLEFPYSPPEEYDFRIVFTRIEGDDNVFQILSVPQKKTQFSWVMGGWGGNVAGFMLVKGKEAVSNPTTVRRPVWLKTKQKYVSVVQVRKDRVRAYLNNELVAEYKTDFSDMTPPGWYDTRNHDCLGIGSWCSPTVFHRVEVVEISGPGTVISQSEGTDLSPTRRKRTD